jgi:hypothetical protein
MSKLNSELPLQRWWVASTTLLESVSKITLVMPLCVMTLFIFQSFKRVFPLILIINKSESNKINV